MSTPPAPEPYPAPPAPGAYAPAPKTNALSIVSLVSSLAALVVLPFIGSLVGVITGHIALSQLKTSGEQGRGMALAGTIIGWISLGLSIIALIAFIAFFSFAVSQSTALPLA